MLDTNVIVSAILFGGKPRQVLETTLAGQNLAVTSPVLIAELSEIMHKKFPFKTNELEYIEEQIKSEFEIVHPRQALNKLHDEADNRVLETASVGKCKFIITGDKELLQLAKFKNIQIVTPNYFLLSND